MGSLWGLAVPLLLLCWKAGVAASTAGLSIGSSAPVVTVNNTEVPAFTQRDRRSSAGAFQTTDLTQYVPLDAQTLSAETASNTLAATSTSSEVNSDTQTISPATETGKTKTTCPAASALDIQITSTTASALETQTSSLAAFSIDTQTTFSASSLDTQTTSAPSSLDTQTTSAPSSLDTQITSAASTLDTQTTSAASSLDTQTTLSASSLDTQTTLLGAASLDIQTTFPTTGTLENQTIFPVELTLKTQTISPVTETRTLAIKMPSNFMVVHPNPTDTSPTSGSPKVEMSTVKTGTVSDLVDAIFDTFYTDDSSEETRTTTVDLLTLAHTSTEAEHLSSESGSTLDNSARALTSPQVLGPDTAPPTKDLVVVSITETETPAIIPGTSDTNHSPTGALSTSESLTLPQSPEANPLSPKTTSSFGTLLTTGTSALAITPEGTLPTSDVTERETTAAQTPASGGTLVTVSASPLKETSALSLETQSHTEVLETITVSRAAGTTMAETISFSGSTSDSSPSAGATTKGSPTSETLTTDDRTSSSSLTGSSPLPFVYSSTASTSKNPNITLAKTTASPETPGMPSSSTPTTSWTRRTPKHDPSEDGGFLLVRVSVASPEDLTEPKAAEKLMHQVTTHGPSHPGYLPSRWGRR
ncbi:mucin-20 isoform X2 [Microtus pennsylvanicus]|uniref:mucin-20 isoform X2 n=1 Tax=Microtus pennsylvanicus TaxID=10058 RepID=UPI003F6A8DC6